MELIRKYINEETVIKNEVYNNIENSIICIICLDIIIDPMICNNCQTVYCKNCIEKWSKIDKRCPKRCINPIYQKCLKIQKLLSKLTFNCEKCRNIINYDEIEKHYISKCQLGNENIEKSLIEFKILDDTDIDEIAEPNMKLTSKIIFFNLIFI